MKLTISIVYLILSIQLISTAQIKSIKPSSDNPFYWEFQGENVMLLGGSKEDNLFQVPDLKEHLDLMEQVGVNYTRNTMSSRDEGNVQPFKKVDDHRYDLSKWNDEYWNRFQNLLKWTQEKEIIVQIEIWAFHDFYDVYGRWKEFLPWNPKYNINYTSVNTKLKEGSYGSFWETNHDFFNTVPKLHNDTVVLKYQNAFVDKILSYTLNYGNILYCMTNEIFTQYSPEWGWYWAKYIKEKAKNEGRQVFVTEMYQNHDLTHDQHKASLDHPEIYDFIDISQNASQLNDRHWERLQWVRKYIKDNPRPINHTKTYGSDDIKWSDGDEQGIERFWRNIIGGAASVRFHRPTTGIGLNEKAQVQIRSARMMLKEINIFNSIPDDTHHLLFDRQPDEAYLSFIQGNQYIVYFPKGGHVKLNLGSYSKQDYSLKWLDIENTEWVNSEIKRVEDTIQLKTPNKNRSWVAILKMK